LDKIILSIKFSLYYVLGALQFVMFVRALLSWIPSLNGSRLSEFLYELTEPFIRPVRSVLERTQLGNSMLDISFLITFILIMLIQEIILVI